MSERIAFPGMFETERARNSERYQRVVIQARDILEGKLYKGSFLGLFETEKQRNTPRYRAAVRGRKRLFGEPWTPEEEEDERIYQNSGHQNW